MKRKVPVLTLGVLALLPGGAHAAERPGWYLMAPPVRSSSVNPSRQELDLEAPLGAWSIEDSFDSATDCRAERDRRIRVSAGEAVKRGTQPEPWEVALTVLALSSKCVSAADPRLGDRGR